MIASRDLNKDSATINSIAPLLFAGDFKGAGLKLDEMVPKESAIGGDTEGGGSDGSEEVAGSEKIEKDSGSGKKKKKKNVTKDPLLGKTLKDLVSCKERKTKKDRFDRALSFLSSPPSLPIPPSLLIFASLISISDEIEDLDTARRFVRQLCNLRTTLNMRVRHTIVSSTNVGNFFFKGGIHALETLIPLSAIEKLAENNLLPASHFPSAIPFAPSYVGRVINLAYKCALLGDQQGAKHGAVLFDKNDKVLSVGWNHRYDSGKKNKKKVIHAEVHAMMQVSDTSLFKDATIFILESHAKGNCFCNAHPCPSCNNVLTKYGVKQAVFTTDDGNLGVWTLRQKDVETPTYDLAKKQGTFVKDDVLTRGLIAELEGDAWAGAPTNK